jgi:hypothetical protein
MIGTIIVLAVIGALIWLYQHRAQRVHAKCYSPPLTWFFGVIPEAHKHWHSFHRTHTLSPSLYSHTTAISLSVVPAIYMSRMASIVCS